MQRPSVIITPAPSAALSCTPRLASVPWPPYALALRSRSLRAPPLSALLCTSPLTAPQPHTATLIISPVLTLSISSQVVLNMQGPGGLFLLRERHRAAA